MVDVLNKLKMDLGDVRAKKKSRGYVIKIYPGWFEANDFNFPVQ